MLRPCPIAGRHYPRSYGDVLAWFPDDEACLDYLDWLRWPNGFTCPHCDEVVGWRLGDGRWSCGGCARRVSAAAGTIFHGTRTPLTVWFAAAWQMTSDKQGVSALGLKRVLEIGSTQTAWAMLHRYRSAMVRPGRDRLSGTVEADETFLGGPEPGVPGRGALGKVLVEVAVERRDKGFGRCRMQVIDDASAPTLRAFLLAHVEPGSMMLTDGFPSYPPACGSDYGHRPTPISGSGHQAHELLPGVHRPGRLTRQAVAGGHAPRSGETRVASALSRPVLLPFQPEILTGPGHALLPAARAGRAERPPDLPFPCRRAGQPPAADAGSTAR